MSGQTGQSHPQRHLDQLVADAFLAAVQPAALETLLAALAAVEQERQALERHWALRLERAREAAARAQRQYDACEPENRLVARTLEQRWNEALLAVEQVEREYAAARRTTLAPLTAEEQAAVRDLAGDLPAVWHAPTTTAADRKRLLRLVIQEVTVTVDAATRGARAVILWQGGGTTTHAVARPPQGWHCTTDAAVVARLRDLAQRLPDHRIAEEFNAEGVRTQTGKAWTPLRVASIRRQHAIPTACPVEPDASGTRGDGFLSSKAAGRRLGISFQSVHLWVRQGILAADQRAPGSVLWVRVTDADVARLDGSAPDDGLLTMAELLAEGGRTRDEVWAAVRAGQYRVYRVRAGGNWAWRFEPLCRTPGTPHGAGV